ncbi:hypothetical protein D7O06_21215 [Salmonella enterica subsp. enterica serovar Virchow]|nr:hypothetical protein [Salmonella enterica subsp. enterica serovar Virchow]
MFRVFSLFMGLSLPVAALSVQMTAADNAASNKIRFMQEQSGTNHSRMAAYIQADQVFSQWCGKTATITDLKRISKQDGFISLYVVLSEGKAQGMTQTKNLLMKNNPKFCKGDK